MPGGTKEEKLALYTEFGKTYTVEQIFDPHFMYQEIANMGYSLSLTSLTLDMYLERRRQHGHEGEPDMVDSLKSNHVLYTYQLLGNEVVKRGAHNSPICEDPVQALQVALYNVLRINHRDTENVDGQ